MKAVTDSTKPPSPLGISVIIPCYNESALIGETIDAVLQVLRSEHYDFEIIVVDDGSSDDSADKIQNLSVQCPELQTFILTRNFGQTTAYEIGLEQAIGKKIVLFSGDLEIPAAEILKVVDALDTFDFVNTERDARWGGLHATKSKIANALLNRISGLSIQDRGSGLKGLRPQVAKSIHLYGEWHRFLPDLASLYTNRISEFKVPFEDRKAGISSYRGSFKSLTVIVDLTTVAFSLLAQRKPYLLLPGRLFGFTGLIIGSFGLLVSLWLIMLKLFYAESLSDRPLFLVSLLLAVLGLIMVMIGALGELVMQIATRLEKGKRCIVRELRKGNGS